MLEDAGEADYWKWRMEKLEAKNEWLREALSGLLEEYEDRRAQFGDEYLWKKHEDEEVIKKAQQSLEVKG